MNNVANARQLAILWHNGQTRRDGVTPYFKHVEDVARRCMKYGEKEQIVAYFHDILEQTEVPLCVFDDFTEDIFVAVKILTKSNGTSYNQYISHIKNNELARRVKIQDILSNLSDDPTKKQIRKYAEALLVLVPY